MQTVLPSPASTASLTVLVLSTRPEHAVAVRRAVAGQPGSVQVVHVSDWLKAWRSTRALAPRLVLIDGTANAEECLLLARNLRLHNPQVDTLIFVEHEGAAILGAGMRPWAVLPHVLDKWLDLQREDKAVAA
jgi:PleD family two-component response regulator